jgi:hypothetical protein
MSENWFEKICPKIVQRFENILSYQKLQILAYFVIENICNLYLLHICNFLPLFV